MTPTPPDWRAEVVGSLLRPTWLKEAFRRFEAGETTEQDSSRAQDRRGRGHRSSGERRSRRRHRR